MSNFIVPKTFIPGTKAKAQDVNENFSAIQSELNIKAEQTGDINQPFLVAPATENNHAVTKEQLETTVAESTEDVYKNFFTPFCIESGYIDENGNPAVLESDGGTLLFNVDDGTLYKPLVATPANKQPQFTVNSIESIDVSSYTNGTYNVFVKSDGSVYLLNNVIYTQKAKPAEPILNCIFENISATPTAAEKYNGTEWEEFNDVVLGSITVASGSITTVVNKPFLNSWSSKSAVETPTASSSKPAVIIENYKSGNSWYRVYSDGWCEQGGKTSSSNVSGSKYVTKNLTYLKPYKESPFANVVASASKAIGHLDNLLSTTNIRVKAHNPYSSESQSMYLIWEVKGYLPEGDY